MPATIGADAEQPVMEAQPSVPSAASVTTLSPGATTSSASPLPENAARRSSEVVAPTVMQRGEAPGQELSAFTLPPKAAAHDGKRGGPTAGGALKSLSPMGHDGARSSNISRPVWKERLT